MKNNQVTFTERENEKKLDRLIEAIKLEAKQSFIDELIKATKAGDKS